MSVDRTTTPVLVARSDRRVLPVRRGSDDENDRTDTERIAARLAGASDA